jgi:hypothetical protein
MTPNKRFRNRGAGKQDRLAGEDHGGHFHPSRLPPRAGEEVLLACVLPVPPRAWRNVSKDFRLSLSLCLEPVRRSRSCDVLAS